ncbi:hypothetical protein ACRRTK_011708 [Alexandromys fortis]
MWGMRSPLQFPLLETKRTRTYPPPPAPNPSVHVPGLAVLRDSTGSPVERPRSPPPGRREHPEERTGVAREADPASPRTGHARQPEAPSRKPSCQLRSGRGSGGGLPAGQERGGPVRTGCSSREPSTRAGGRDLCGTRTPPCPGFRSAAGSSARGKEFRRLRRLACKWDPLPGGASPSSPGGVTAPGSLAAAPRPRVSPPRGGVKGFPGIYRLLVGYLAVEVVDVRHSVLPTPHAFWHWGLNISRGAAAIDMATCFGNCHPKPCCSRLGPVASVWDGRAARAPLLSTVCDVAKSDGKLRRQQHLTP